jgi:hypothetical protein
MFWNLFIQPFNRINMERETFIGIVNRLVKGKHERKTIIDAADIYAYSKNSGNAPVSGWQDFPEQKPTEGQLVAMSFDGVGMFTHYYTAGLEENFRPFQKMRFIVLPA